MKKSPQKNLLSLFIPLLALLTAPPGGVLFAQDGTAASGSSAAAEPEMPKVSLPDLAEEVKALENQGVAAPLPPLPPLPIPDRQAPLPEETALVIPESAYRTEATLDTRPRPDLGETFSEASVGAALWAGVSANLSIYRPGTDPSLGISFAHESRDGLTFQDPGEGFSYRRTSLRGRLRSRGESENSWSLTASFSDEANGLQGRSSDFFGLAHRFFDAEGKYGRPLGPLSFNVGLRGSSASLSMERGRTLNLGDTGVQEIALNPSMALSFENGPLSLSLGGDYSFLGLLGDPSSVPGSGRSAQLGGVEAQAALELSPAFLVGVSFGGAFSSAYLYTLPFSLWTSFALGEYAMVNAQGGLATDQVSLASQWRINPYLDIGALLPEDSRWFGALESDLYPLPDWTVRLGALWAMSYQGGRIKPLAPPTGSSRMLYSYTSETYKSLESRFSLRKRFGQGLIGLGWNADWLDLPTAEKPHRFFAEVEYRELQERYGGSLMIAAASDGVGLDTPKIDAQAFLRFGSGLRLIAEFFDIAMAFKGTEGRVRYRPYATDGFQASLGMQFSF